MLTSKISSKNQTKTSNYSSYFTRIIAIAFAFSLFTGVSASADTYIGALNTSKFCNNYSTPLNTQTYQRSSNKCYKTYRDQWSGKWYESGSFNPDLHAQCRNQFGGHAYWWASGYVYANTQTLNCYKK